MTETRFETLNGWDIIGWSMPRNNLFKMWLLDFRSAQSSTPRRCEAYFIAPSSVRVSHISSGSGNRVSIVNVKDREQDNSRALEFQLVQNGLLAITCRSAELLLLP